MEVSPVGSFTLSQPEITACLSKENGETFPLLISFTAAFCIRIACMRPDGVIPHLMRELSRYLSCRFLFLMDVVKIWWTCFYSERYRCGENWSRTSMLSEKKQDVRTVKQLPTVKFHRNMFNISHLSVNVKGWNFITEKEILQETDTWFALLKMDLSRLKRYLVIVKMDIILPECVMAGR